MYKENPLFDSLTLIMPIKNGPLGSIFIVMVEMAVGSSQITDLGFPRMRPASPLSSPTGSPLGGLGLQGEFLTPTEFDSLIPVMPIKNGPLGSIFIVMVEMRRVELLSESISTKLSPSAAGVLLFRLFTRPSAGW